MSNAPVETPRCGESYHRVLKGVNSIANMTEGSLFLIVRLVSVDS